MKRIVSFISLVGLSAFISICPPLRAQESGVRPEDQSKHYAAVAKHLELGGFFYAYLDIDGDVKELTEMVDGFLGALREQGEDVPPKLTAAGIVNELGLEAVTAMGASSRKLGGLFHNRAFLAMPQGPKGLFKILGDKPAPFASSKLAPNGADLIIEQDFNATAVLDIVRNIAQMVDEGAVAEIEQALDQPMQPLSITFGEFVKKLNTKVTLVAMLDPNKKLEISNPEALPDQEGEAKAENLEVPMVDALLCVEKMGWLFPELKKFNEDAEEPYFEYQSGEGFEALLLAKPIGGGDLEIYKPIVHHDKASGRLYVATRPEFLTKCLEGKDTLANDAAFKTAMTGLPMEGNGLVYASSDALKAYGTLMKEVMKNEPEELSEIMERYLGFYLPKSEEGVAMVRANLPDGILFVSNSTETHKSTLMTATVFPLALIGGAAVPIFMERHMAQQQFEQHMEEDMPEANEGAEPAPGDGAKGPAKKVVSNLQEISFAAESYFLDNPKTQEVAYPKLIEAGYLFEIDSVDGESYKDLSLKRSGGKIAVKIKDGSEISHTYPAVSD